jgi:steroid delta-isomerase-like uncharacterized protein
MWNRWSFEAVDRLVHPELEFRGSLGNVLKGREAFKDYMREVRAAFPDFENHIEELLEEGARVVARLTYRGTHRGPLWGLAPTGRRVEYVGVAIFGLEGGLFRRGWVLGDTAGLRAQLEGRRIGAMG